VLFLFVIMMSTSIFTELRGGFSGIPAIGLVIGGGTSRGLAAGGGGWVIKSASLDHGCDPNNVSTPKALGALHTNTSHIPDRRHGAAGRDDSRIVPDCATRPASSRQDINVQNARTPELAWRRARVASARACRTPTRRVGAMTIGLDLSFVGAILFRRAFSHLSHRKNIIIILMSIELIFAWRSISLVAFLDLSRDIVGQVFCAAGATVAAAEARSGLRCWCVFRNRGSIAVEASI